MAETAGIQYPDLPGRACGNGWRYADFPTVGRREGDGGPKGQLVFHLYFHWDGAVLFCDHGPVYGSDP